MRKLMPIGVAIVLAGIPFCAAGAISNEALQAFAARVADNSYPSTVRVSVGTLPPSWTSSIPLPSDLPLLGSVQHLNQGSTEIYYRPADAAAAYDAYLSALQRAGFRETKPPDRFGQRGGFTPSSGLVRIALFCRAQQGVNIQAPRNDGDDLRITVLSAEKGPLNSCTEQASRLPMFWSPVPSLEAPAGAIVTLESLAGMSVGFSSNGRELGDISSAALVQGNFTVPQLLTHYRKQMVAAGWQVKAMSGSPNGAFAGFANRTYGQTWDAVIVIYAVGTHRLRATLIALGSPLMRPPPASSTVAHVPEHAARNAQPIILELAKRILTADNQLKGSIFVKAMPPGLPRGIPRPQGTLIGSTSLRPAASGAAYDYAGGYTLYYSLTQKEWMAWNQVLRKDGWTPQSLPFRSGGFEGTVSQGFTAYCKSGMPRLSTNADPDTGAVTISISRQESTSGCERAETPEISQPSLPTLVVEGAVKSRWTGSNAAGVSFVADQTPSQLLDLFTRQLTIAGWKPSIRTVNDTVGAQTYARDDKGKATPGADGLSD